MEERNEGFTADRLREIICELAERTGISTEEAAERISQAIQGVAQSIKDLCDGLIQIFEQIEESDIFNIEPRHRRRKQERDRARLIEQRYSVKIRYCERARPFRRIYKPP